MTAVTGQTDSLFFQTARIGTAQDSINAPASPPKSPTTAPKTCSRSTTSKPNDQQNAINDQGAAKQQGYTERQYDAGQRLAAVAGINRLCYRQYFVVRRGPPIYP